MRTVHYYMYPLFVLLNKTISFNDNSWHQPVTLVRQENIFCPKSFESLRMNFGNLNPMSKEKRNRKKKNADFNSLDIVLSDSEVYGQTNSKGRINLFISNGN